MYTKIKIKLHKMEDILNFVKIVMRYDEDINIYGYMTEFDAKSIMALFAMDYTIPPMVEIVTEDEAITHRFYNDMRNFMIS